jgi:hypothetical protein
MIVKKYFSLEDEKVLKNRKARRNTEPSKLGSDEILIFKDLRFKNGPHLPLVKGT